MTLAVGRNDPCPCGSGKKYKKCCWSRDQEQIAMDAKSKSRSSSPAASTPPPSPFYGSGQLVEDDIDRLSNSIVDLIKAGDLEEAERRCDELRERYPEVVDWMMRLAAVREAQGNRGEAARYYRDAADFAERAGDYDPEMIADFRLQADELDKPS